MATKTQAVTNMNPTSDMTLDDIIRDLEARCDKAREDMLAFVVDGVRSGRLSFLRKDPEADPLVRLAVSGPTESDYDDSFEARQAYIARLENRAERLDDARDALERAHALRDALEGED